MLILLLLSVNKLYAHPGKNFKAGGLMSSDFSSLIFGVMNIPFFKCFVASDLGLLLFIFLWTLLGAKGDLSNPFTFLYALPALLFSILVSVIMSKRQKMKNRNFINNSTETEDK